MNCKVLLLLITLFFQTLSLSAQQEQVNKEVNTQGQLWFGYMTSGRINSKFSIWNDTHLVPGGFFIVRTGLTRHFYQNLSVTGGFAYLSIPTISNKINLQRNEFRPWAQLAVNHKVSPKLYMANRIRYDARFKQDFLDGSLLNSYSFNHRVRMLISMRFPLKGYEIKGGTAFLNFSNEVHVNFGEIIINNHLDQNRFWITYGYQFERITLQVGYMHRFVQLPSGNQFQVNNTLIFWLTHQFDFKGKKEINDVFRQP